MLKLLIALALTSCCGLAFAQEAERPGHTDTPEIPGQSWRVHDADRPRPEVIDPATPSTQDQPGRPPSDATVLFAGDSLDAWVDYQGNAPDWDLVDGAMVVPKKSDKDDNNTIRTRETFGDCQLHIEWKAPTPPLGASQGRGNSGVFFHEQYEVQVLDSYDNETYADGQAAAIYGQYPPLVNATRPPGEWNVYDIVFEGPRFDDDGNLQRPAIVTVFHNGVLVQNHEVLVGPTTHKNVGAYKPHPPEGHIQLQDHGNPVAFRNIWIRELKPRP